jgi:hypothetical protein
MYRKAVIPILQTNDVDIHMRLYYYGNEALKFKYP